MSDLVKMSMTMLKKKHEKWVGTKNFLITKKDVPPNYNNGQCLAMGTFRFYSKKNCVLIYHEPYWPGQHASIRNDVKSNT